MAIPPDVWEGIKTTAEIAANTFLAIRAQSKKIVPKPPPRPEPKYIQRHDGEGRDLVERVNAQLNKPAIITLTGAGGVGKTTIAIEVATKLFEKRIGGFKEGIVWISADGRPDFGLLSLVDTVLDKLVPVDQLEAIRRLPLDAKRELARRLLAERKRCLLALDNFETIPEKEQGLIVAYLAELPCPKLVTSRKPLPKGEEIAVGPMTPKEARAFLQMRVERSEQPERLRGVDWDEVAKVADYNPMLMRWVVAQLEQAMRPQDVFDEIARGKGEAPERIFYQTFNNLGEDGQMALLALALFVPTASREALAAVCGFEDSKDRVNEAIRTLAAFDLLDTAIEDDRLGIVALTRRLTEAQLKKDERTEGLKKRFVAHFLAYAVAHPGVTKEDLDALDEERENLLAALDYAYTAEDWQSLIAILGTIAFPGLLYTRGYWDDAVRWGDRGLEAARKAHDEASIAWVAHNLANIYESRGKYDEAKDLYNQSLEIHKQVGDQAGIAKSLHQLGIIAQDQGDYQVAKDLYNQGLEIKRNLGDQAGIAKSLGQLGRVAQDQGRYQEAKDLYNQSLEIDKQLGNQAGIATSLHNLAMVAHLQGDYQEAKDLYNQSLEIKRNLGDQWGMAASLYQLGRIAEETSNKEEAAQFYREALAIFERLGSPEAEKARRALARVTAKKPKE